MKFKELKELPDNSGVYCIKNLLNQKVYIGSCISFLGRLKRHYYYLRMNKHHSQKLQRSWNKYGEDSFEIFILKQIDEIDAKKLLEIEEHYIKEYDSFNNGYNMTDKCLNYTSFTQSEEAVKNFIKSRSKAVVAINRFSGEIVNTFESITKAANFFNDQTTNISSVCKGKLRYVKDTVFVYEENFDPCKDYTVKEHHNKNVPKSEEIKAKMRKNSKKSHKVYKYNKDNELIEEFDSVRYCEQCEGFKMDTLRYKLNKFLDTGFLYTKEKLKI